ncbi:MAG: hypothetical protein H6760_04045 [Candidatus Nomurabacteria bacterium]|nr:MAG: hypothetical protein H6760_04045 [Candidatus Nomurabacteria bacterium]
MTVRNLRSGLTATVTEPLRVTGDPLHVHVRRTMEGGESNGKTKLTTWSLDNVEIVPVAQEPVDNDRQVG